MKSLQLLSDQVSETEIRVILRELARTADVPGDVVEFGCYVGTTSVYLARELKGDKRLHVYDSFAGLPEKTEFDASPAGEQFQPGELCATKKQFTSNLRRAGVAMPAIHKGWFQDLTAADVPEKVSFAFLDGDYYESVLTPLKLIENRLSPGAIIVVDDYTNEALPGAQKAVQEWLKTHKGTVVTEVSLGIIRLR